MPKPKVVQISKDKAKLIAEDPKGRRIILSIGHQRIGVDFVTRITRLPPDAGDQPAMVFPMKKRRK